MPHRFSSAAVIESKMLGRVRECFRVWRVFESSHLATDFGGLLGDGGPSDETADEMIQAIREWRDTLSDRNLD